MNKLCLALLFFLGGCQQSKIKCHIHKCNGDHVCKGIACKETCKDCKCDKRSHISPAYYQAYDHKWNDPTINPVFPTKAEAQEYAKENSMGGHHSYEVREVNYRYEVRIGFSDYTYSNGTWRDTIFASPSLKESEKYLNEHKAYDTPLVIYDLKTENITNKKQLDNVDEFCQAMIEAKEFIQKNKEK